MKRQFIERRFHKAVLDVINTAEQVIVGMQAQGYVLTLRQLYYRFISADLFPATWIDEKYNRSHGLALDTKNTVKNYKRLGGILNDARLAGYIDWDAMTDRTRWLRDYDVYNDAKDFIQTIADKYNEDVWATQDSYCEVWVEKDALVGVIERPCQALHVPYFPCKGYVSQSEAYEAGQRLKQRIAEGRNIVILHLGDHDPSGIDMSRDIHERLSMFARTDDIDFRRIALNRDQIDHYGPPANPAKETDSRYASYEADHGDESWELDALEPKVIAELVRSNIESVLDRPRYNAAIEQMEQERSKLDKLTDNWDRIEEILADM